jgi:hypothetical protein
MKLRFRIKLMQILSKCCKIRFSFKENLFIKIYSLILKNILAKNTIIIIWIVGLRFASTLFHLLDPIAKFKPS